MWYSLRLEGTVFSRDMQREVNLMIGAPSLVETLERLTRRMEAGVDEATGTTPTGLKAALSAQLALCQWTSWSAFKQFEREAGRAYPPIAKLRNGSLFSGSFSPDGGTPATGPDSPRM